ncbi:MAG: insulinase family protein [Elusimicrobia bacterium]|nr:insulinase family protein [Elusimicrobiota bacterium]
MPAEEPRPDGEAPPAVRGSKAARPPSLERFALPNGLTVVLAREAKLPLFELRLSLRAGKLAEGPAEGGLSEAAASLFFKGLPGQDAASIARGLAALGVSVGIDCRRELAILSASGLSRSAETLLRRLGQLLRRSAYPEPEARLWREQTLERLGQLRIDPEFLTSEAVKEELYPGHPYGRPFPSEDELRRATGSRVRAFQRRAYRARGATLVLAGDFAFASARRWVERTLGALAGGPEPAAAPEPPPQGPARLRAVERAGSRQLNLSLVQVLPLRAVDPDYPAFLVANHILGGSSSSRLFLNLRIDKGYTYGAYSRAASLQRCSTWIASAETRAEVAAKALAEMRLEVRRLREERVPEAALAAAKRHLAGVFAIRLSSLEGLAGTLWKLETDGLPPERELARFVPRLEAVSSEDVRRAARRALDPARMAAIAVGEKADLAALA